MKKSDRLKPKKKRKYRLDHESNMSKYYQRMNDSVYKDWDKIIDKLPK